MLDNAVVTDSIFHFEKNITVDGENSFGNTQPVGETDKRLGELAALFVGAQKSVMSVAVVVTE